MTQFEIKEAIEQSELIDMSRTQHENVLSFYKSNQIYIMQLDCFVRVFYNNKLIASSVDILIPSEREKVPNRRNWIRASRTLFDDCLDCYKDKLIGAKVTELKWETNDFMIIFDNGSRIDVRIDTTEKDGSKARHYGIFVQDGFDSNYRYPDNPSQEKKDRFNY